MLQYGYANFGESGYQLVSADPFLQDSGRVSQLNSLTHYTMNTSPAYCRQGQMTYTGLLTDLGYRGENPRYYFQASGPSFVRGGSCAHGYVQADEREFFGEPFLSLLRAQFLAPRDIQKFPAAGAAEYFPAVEFPELDESITPVPIDDTLLEAVLEQLLQQGRVLLRLPCSGDEAPLYARRVLLRLYSCLPYAARKFCGFITNVPLSRVMNPEMGDELPAAVKLVLVDGDAQLPERLPGFAVFDMNGPAPELSRQESTAAFLKFLLHAAADKDGNDRRERYFRMVSKGLESVDSQRSLSLQTYRDVFLMQELADLPLCVPTLHQWANWLQRNKGVVAAGIRKQFLEILAAKITPEQAYACLTSPEGQQILPELDHLEGLWQLHRLGQEEETASAAAILVLLETVLQNEGTVCLGELLSGWYSEKAVDLLSLHLLHAADKNLPTPNALAELGRVRRLVDVASSLAGKNRVAATLVCELSKRLQETEEKMQTHYNTCVAEERSRAAGMLDGIQNVRYSVLAQVYEQTQQPDSFPLCMERMQAGVGFAQAFGQELAQRLCKLAESRPLPAVQSELPDFIEDYKALMASSLYQSGLLGLYIRQLTPLLRAIEEYEKAKEDISLSAQLTLLHRSYGAEFAPMGRALLEDVRQSVREFLQDKPSVALDQLPPLLGILELLAPVERPLVMNLSTALWTVFTAAPEALSPMAGHADQWERLGDVLHCKVKVCFRDGCSQDMPVQDMRGWMQWVQGLCTVNVPAPVLRCAKEMPALAVCESATVQQLQLLVGAVGQPERCALYRCMLERPMPDEYTFAKKAVSLLRQTGARGEDLLRRAGKGWENVIAAVYSDPMAGPQGESLRQLQEELPILRHQMEACAKAVKEENERWQRILRMVMAGAVALEGVLPMLLLWIFDGAELLPVLTVLVALVLQTALVIIVLLCIKSEEAKEIRRDLLWYGLGAAPGLLLTLIGVVLAILL